MSLPTKAYFYYKDEQVNECFINCGWFYDERQTKSQLVDFLNDNYKFDWDYVEVYDQEFTKNEDFTGNHPRYFYDIELIKRKECEKQPNKTYIDEFRDEYSWLSNFYSVDIEYDGNIYPSVEHAYMSAKSDDMAWKMFCMNSNNTAGQVKKASREIDLVSDWDNIKNDVMYECLVNKFNHTELKDKLLATKNAIIREGNRWNDTYWGVCLRRGYGDNHLGKMIMKIRKALKQGTKEYKHLHNQLFPLLRETVMGSFAEKFAGVQPMDSNILKNLMEIKMNKVIEVKEYIVRTSKIEYDTSTSRAIKMSDEEILQDVAYEIDKRGLNKCSSAVSESTTDVKLNGISLSEIQPVKFSISSEITDDNE